ncbi:MAG TPA: hypothetical protein VF267_03310 [Gammaproteobacteria bacterium]
MRKHRIDGRCHCGNIEYTLHTDTPPDDVTLRICRCDFCLRHRPRYWSDPSGALQVDVHRPEQVLCYRFGHGTADFVLCRECGVFAFAVTASEGMHFAVTNLNLALGRDAQPREAFLEALDENEAERNARRRRNWTPVVAGWPVN